MQQPSEGSQNNNNNIPNNPYSILQEKYESLQASYDDLYYNYYEPLKTKFDNLFYNHDKLQIKFNKHLNDYSDLKNEFDEADFEYRRTTSVNKKLSKMNWSLNYYNKNKDIRIEKLLTQQQQLKDEIVTFKTTENKLSQRINSLTQSRDALKNNNEQTITKLNALERQFSINEKKNIYLKKKVTKANNHINKLLEETTNFKDNSQNYANNKKLKKQLYNTQNDKKELNQKLLEIQNNNQILNKQLTELHKSNRVLEQQPTKNIYNSQNIFYEGAATFLLVKNKIWSDMCSSLFNEKSLKFQQCLNIDPVIDIITIAACIKIDKDLSCIWLGQFYGNRITSQFISQQIDIYQSETSNIISNYKYLQHLAPLISSVLVGKTFIATNSPIGKLTFAAYFFGSLRKYIVETTRPENKEESTIDEYIPGFIIAFSYAAYSLKGLSASQSKKWEIFTTVSTAIILYDAATLVYSTAKNIITIGLNLISNSFTIETKPNNIIHDKLYNESYDNTCTCSQVNDTDEILINTTTLGCCVDNYNNYDDI